jgi:poly(3-hydroxybutyrate) depolymerase
MPRSHYDYFKDLIKGDDASTEAHRKFYDEYNAVLDMDADYYLETIKVVFQDFSLVNGTWDVRAWTAGSSVCVRRTSRPPPCSRWRVSWTTFPAPARPLPCMTFAVASPTQQRHLEAKAPATTASSAAGAGGRRWREMVYPKCQAHDSKAITHRVESTGCKACDPGRATGRRARTQGRQPETDQAKTPKNHNTWRMIQRR